MTKQEIQELKASLSIREVIGRYMTLNRVGRRWMGLCPFHGDRHPSLSVNEEKGSFVCYACGERGDVFAFVSKVENVGFIEAVKKLTVDNVNRLTVDNGQLPIKKKEKGKVRISSGRTASSKPEYRPPERPSARRGPCATASCRPAWRAC